MCSNLGWVREACNPLYNGSWKCCHSGRCCGRCCGPRRLIAIHCHRILLEMLQNTILRRNLKWLWQGFLACSPVSQIACFPLVINLHPEILPIGRKSIKKVERHEMITSPDVILTQIFACQRTYLNLFNQCNTVRS